MILSICLTLFIAIKLCAQKPIDKKISTSYTNFSLTQIFYDLEVKHKVKVYFDIKEAPTFKVTRAYNDEQIWALVSDLLNGTKLRSFSYDDNSIVVIDMKKMSRAAVESLVNMWKDGSMDYPKNDAFETIIKLYGTAGNTTDPVNYSLQLLYNKSNEPLPCALIFTDDFALNEVTDQNGTCNLKLTSGKHLLNITYTSYQTIKLDVDIHQSADEIDILERPN